MISNSPKHSEASEAEVVRCFSHFLGEFAFDYSNRTGVQCSYLLYNKEVDRGRKRGKKREREREGDLGTVARRRCLCFRRLWKEEEITNRKLKNCLCTQFSSKRIQADSYRSSSSLDSQRLLTGLQSSRETVLEGGAVAGCSSNGHTCQDAEELTPWRKKIAG